MKTQHEQWKAIAECNGEYYISDHGRVKSFKYGNERMIKPMLTGAGLKYQSVILYTKEKKIQVRVHRLVAVHFIPNQYNKPQINHIDGNKLNNHFTNLEWNTHTENQRHAWLTGLKESVRIARSKAVIDIVTNIKYPSLKNACDSIGENYGKHQQRIFHKRKNQRFFQL